MKYVSVLIIFLILIVPSYTLAIPTANYYGEGEDIFDDWDVCRTNAAGEDGFFSITSETDYDPVIARESLGENIDRAYLTGAKYAQEYPDINQRAEEIFIFVRDSIKYTSDKSQFGVPEFAQNADEMAHIILEGKAAYGDCEDYAVLLSVMYKGAGLRSSIILTREHAAAAVFLPDYRRSAQVLTINGETGWIWAEATGGNNPLGWIPEGYARKVVLAMEVTDEALFAEAPPDKELVTVTRKEGGGFDDIPVPSFFTILAILWLLSSFQRRRSA